MPSHPIGYSCTLAYWLWAVLATLTMVICGAGRPASEGHAPVHHAKQKPQQAFWPKEHCGLSQPVAAPEQDQSAIRGAATRLLAFLHQRRRYGNEVGQRGARLSSTQTSGTRCLRSACRRPRAGRAYPPTCCIALPRCCPAQKTCAALSASAGAAGDLSRCNLTRCFGLLLSGVR